MRIINPEGVLFYSVRLTKKALLSLYLSPNPHLLQVNCGFGAYASLKIALFILTSTNEDDPFLLLGHPHENYINKIKALSGPTGLLLLLFAKRRE